MVSQVDVEFCVHQELPQLLLLSAFHPHESLEELVQRQNTLLQLGLVNLDALIQHGHALLIAFSFVLAYLQDEVEEELQLEFGNGPILRQKAQVSVPLDSGFI